MTERLTGGCQCGAVRFAVDGELGRAAICHCRMCQKAFGGFFGPLVSAPTVVWTRGEPKYFQSSELVRRGFCGACGTPLTFEAKGDPIDLAIGAFDNPKAIPPAIQHDTPRRMPWLQDLAELPLSAPEEMVHIEAYYASIQSNQHPDHDTATWAPKGGAAKTGK